MSPGELIIDHCDGAKHELLEGSYGRELTRGYKREVVGTEGSLGVTVSVLDNGAGLRATESCEERSSVWVD